jgi:hypothetical protein
MKNKYNHKSDDEIKGGKRKEIEYRHKLSNT